MSAKWRALQHRHRYTYSAVVFPHSYLDSLTQLTSDELSQKFCTQLIQFASLNSIYAQVNQVKNLTTSFNDLLLGVDDENLVSIASKLFLELLFLENSFTLHKTLLSVLSKNKKFRGLIGGCFRELCEEYGALYGKGKRFCVSRVALSMMSTPKLGYLVDVVDECCVLVALDVVSGLKYVVEETNGLARPSPIVMEQCQEALSCMYYLLQRFPSRFTRAGDSQNRLVPEDSCLLEMVVSVILSILKSPAFSRDCFVAAGVSFCAALQVWLSPQELGYLIMEGVFERKVFSLVGDTNVEYKNALSVIPFSRDMCFELRNVSPLSRLCFIRGVLTAVSRIVLNFSFVVEIEGSNYGGTVENSNRCLQSILYDCILPELCKYCENPIDSHFNFHALTVMQICLQQIKTSILADLIDRPTQTDPISEDLGARVLRIIWNNLEDPLSQTVKQVHLTLELFLDIKATIYRGDEYVKLKSLLGKIASDLLCLGVRCKGRYIPLASLTKRLGAKTLLVMSPNLLFDVVQAYIDDDVCSAATSFLKCFLQCLRNEFWDSDGVDRGYEIYRGYCLPPFLYGLASGISKLRSNLNIYALPSLLEVDVDSIFPMLSFLSIGVGTEADLVYPEPICLEITFGLEQKVAVLVSLLKVSRSLQLFEGDVESCHNPTMSAEGCMIEEEHALIHLNGIQVRIPSEWLVLALTHVDESLRVDAAESLFLNPKTASLPSTLELNLMRISVPLNMRCCSTAFQMKWGSLFRKFFSRVRTALERQVKQGTWQPSDWGKNELASLCMSNDESIVSRAENLYQFMKWLSCLLFFSCYPSAPYERKIMAMELIMIMVNIWSIVPPLPGKCEVFSTENLYLFSEGLTRPDSTMLLVGSIIDSWDRLRENSFRILLNFPTPLPGISSESRVQEVISWAKKLVCSPRVRESDAGALALRLMFRKYVLDLGWNVGASVNVICRKPESELSNRESQITKSRFPVILYINSLIEWLEAVVEKGEKDLFEACQDSFVHGVLLALRYTFEELDWNSDVVTPSITEMRGALGKLLQLVMRITSLALWVVSADALCLAHDLDDIEDDGFLLDNLDEMGSLSSAFEHEAKDMTGKEEARPTAQIVMVGCWLAMKEVSLLLGTIIRKIPLPTATSSIDEGAADLSMDHLMPNSDAVLDVNQLEVIGNHFLEVLFKMKHNGAIDKTRAGFTALCNRLLCSDDPRLCQLTESWMEQLMERTVAKGQTVDDLLRRSAGIPAAFSAFFLSEPQGAPKKLLPKALRWLIELAGGSLLDQAEPNNIVGKLQNNAIIPDVEDAFLLKSEIDANLRSAKIRVEGVIPTVHAFNVLRAAFNDANLATDTSGFSAEAMIISIRSFSSPHWEIRNSACLAYTSLVRRMVGFLNVHKRESARRAITSLEFFHRYPALHSFVFNELKVATELLQGAQSNSNLASIVHPSLCPVLILLSRLNPSPIASEEGDCLDPFLFMPFIQRCSTQRNMRIRKLASRALTGLVSNEKLHLVLLDIASGLPCSKNQTETDVSHVQSSTSFNAIHGILLLLSALVDANCRNLAEFSVKDMILNNLIKTLYKCSWIGNPRSCPCPILNGSFLKLLDHMLSIAGRRQATSNYDAICTLLSELCSESLDIGSESLFPDSTSVELRKQAATSYFRCVYLYEEHAEAVLLMPSHSSTNMPKAKPLAETGFGVEGRFASYMSDASYEVRLATFKWLLQFVKTASQEFGDDQNGSEVAAIAHWAKANLQSTLIRLLSLETNHKCAYYILRIIFAWNLLHFHRVKDTISGDNLICIGEMDFDSVLVFWNKLVSIHDSARHTKTLETLICCLGLCVKRFASFLRNILPDIRHGKLEVSNRCTLLCEWIKHYVSLIKQYSDASQQVNLRKAAAESVVSSCLLEQAGFISSLVNNGSNPSENANGEQRDYANLFGYLILDTWFTCIKLLEDEDVFIRKELALEVQKCFPPNFRGRSLAVVVPAQVEKVIELCFELLSATYGHWDHYLDYLLRWVSDASSYVAPKGDLIRRVFDKEIDNYHEEKLLICQLCCSNLVNLELSKSRRFEFRTFLRTWRTHFSGRLLSFSSDHIGKLEEADWVGGVGNHKDAFLPLYGNLLGFYAVSKCILQVQCEGEDTTISLLEDVVELEKAIRPFLGNPLVCNLYILVVRLHQDMVGASSNHLISQLLDGIQIWDGFNPYFLIS